MGCAMAGRLTRGTSGSQPVKVRHAAIVHEHTDWHVVQHQKGSSWITHIQGLCSHP